MSFAVNLIAILLIGLTFAVVGNDLNIGSIIIFVIVMGWLVHRYKKNFKREAGILLVGRTVRLNNFIMRLGGRFSRFWIKFGTVGIIVGIIAGIWSFVVFVFIFIDSLFAEQLLPAGGLALPTLSTQGSITTGAVLIPFWYWIISIAVLLAVHEGNHALQTAAHKIKFKSIGIPLLFGVFPIGAFVDPDEKKFAKAKKIKQLRVLAGGSFANFITAAIVIIILIVSSTAASAISVQHGVSFGNYIVGPMNISSIFSVNGTLVEDAKDIEGIVNSGEDILEGETTKGDKFFISKELLETNQELLEQGIAPVFPDLPAVRNRLEGTITQIGNMEIKTRQDLTEALLEAGPGNEVTIKTVVSGESKEFQITTTNAPEPSFSLDSRIPIMVEFERIIPGSIDSFQNSRCIISLFGVDCFSSLFGMDRNTRTTYQFQQFLWENIGEEYPDLKIRAEEKVKFIESKINGLPESGYLGILNPSEETEYIEELKPYEAAFSWLSGLLFWIFLLNLGVGMFNTLPVFITDGARIWDIVFERLAPKKHNKLTLAFSIITVFIIIAVIIGIPLIRG